MWEMGMEMAMEIQMEEGNWIEWCFFFLVVVVWRMRRERKGMDGWIYEWMDKWMSG